MIQTLYGSLMEAMAAEWDDPYRLMHALSIAGRGRATISDDELRKALSHPDRIVVDAFAMFWVHLPQRQVELMVESITNSHSLAFIAERMNISPKAAQLMADKSNGVHWGDPQETPNPDWRDELVGWFIANINSKTEITPELLTLAKRVAPIVPAVKQGVTQNRKLSPNELKELWELWHDKDAAVGLQENPRTPPSIRAEVQRVLVDAPS